ncbi:MAG: LD-carboxypeptidase [Rhodothermaceae bacterium]|nr:LD-carboxypeptidase [Rhodothermaceae bacterium]MYF63745.1 LD-carboxypeptidase [Rhodothermaceae bacterium]MYI84164.1 LD-carboxypeptidase [Rhodothermaceae bacterium]
MNYTSSSARLPNQPLGIVAPASPPRISERLERGLSALAADGYVTHWDPDQLTPNGYLAGSDAQRTEQFNQALVRNRFLMALRGGYGCLRILNGIDYSAARRERGVLIGYSDITALQLSLFKHAGWRSISGPVVVEWGEIDTSMKEAMRELLEGKLPPPVADLKTLQEGQCTGTLLGGNLSSIVRMIGSPHLPSFQGALLFIEDVNEAAYRIDALFAQLKNAGILKKLGGLIVGSFTGPDTNDEQSRRNVNEIIAGYTREYTWPVVAGLTYGHFIPRHILPIGVLARLTARVNEGRLDILEPVVHPKFPRTDQK